MNERIRELAEQAGLPDLLKLTVSHIATDAMEKFAELLIQDTISKIESVGWKSSNDVPFEITDLFVGQIKHHFGVE